MGHFGRLANFTNESLRFSDAPAACLVPIIGILPPSIKHIHLTCFAFIHSLRVHRVILFSTTARMRIYSIVKALNECYFYLELLKSIQTLPRKAFHDACLTCPDHFEQFISSISATAIPGDLVPQSISTAFRWCPGIHQVQYYCPDYHVDDRRSACTDQRRPSHTDSSPAHTNC